MKCLHKKSLNVNEGIAQESINCANKAFVVQRFLDRVKCMWFNNVKDV
jgi:hypothetical protein